MPAYGLGDYGLGRYGVGEGSADPYPQPVDPGWHQWLPEVYLTVADSVWPNCPPLPLGTGRVFGFTVERQIVAANMPGQVRGRTGFSIGTASVSIRQAEGRPLAPWAQSDRRITAGQSCDLYAQDSASGQRFGLGAWQVQSPDGSLSRADVGVELIESQYAGRKADARLPVARDVDPAWIIDQLARQAGFFSTPAASAGTVLSAPLAGSLHADVGRMIVGSGPTWSTATGIPGLASASGFLPAWDVSDQSGGNFARTLITLNIAGTVTLGLYVLNDLIEIELTTGTIRARRNGGGWTATQSFTAGLDADWPMRVQVVVERSGSTLTFAARSSAAGELSAPVSIAPAEMAALFRFGVSSISANGGVSGLDVTNAALGSPAGPWAAPTALISLLDGRVETPWLPDGGDVWTALQRTCDAYAAAGWVSREGILTVRNRHEMAGSGRPKRLVDVGVRVEDLAWTLDADDYADRLEVTWWPVTWPDEFADPFEQALSEKLHVPAGRSVTVKVDLGGYVSALASWWSVGDPEFPTTVASEWDANTTADGSGAAVVAGVSVTAVQVSPSQARVTVTNSTAADVWMVDFDGAPAMILRGVGAALQESEQVITYGKPDIDAVNPLTIDLGKLVQSRADAEALAGYLWERVNTPRFRLNQIRMPLDWSRDLGDILTLSHPASDLSVNVLVVSDRKTGTAGEIAHTCDLILLPPTLDDFAAVWDGQTLDDVAAVWAGQNLAAFAAGPLKTEA